MEDTDEISTLDRFYIEVASQLGKSPYSITPIASYLFGNSLDLQYGNPASIRDLLEYVFAKPVSLRVVASERRLNDQDKNYHIRFIGAKLYLFGSRTSYSLPLAFFGSFPSGSAFLENFHSLLSSSEDLPGSIDTNTHFESVEVNTNQHTVTYSGYLGQDMIRRHFNYPLLLVTVILIYSNVLSDAYEDTKRPRSDFYEAIGTLDPTQGLFSTNESLRKTLLVAQDLATRLKRDDVSLGAVISALDDHRAAIVKTSLSEIAAYEAALLAPVIDCDD
jgi:hypothetical protein